MNPSQSCKPGLQSEILSQTQKGKKKNLSCPRGKIKSERVALWLGCYKANLRPQETTASLLPPTCLVLAIFQHPAGLARGFLQ